VENQARGNWRSRSTKRITITIPASLFQPLEEASARQGRSISNLSAFLLEDAVEKHGN
jgi:metal-responsive CopG/Arc/MetJ family transcriptional regulator